MLEVSSVAPPVIQVGITSEGIAIIAQHAKPRPVAKTIELLGQLCTLLHMLQGWKVVVISLRIGRFIDT